MHDASNSNEAKKRSFHLVVESSLVKQYASVQLWINANADGAFVHSQEGAEKKVKYKI